MQDEYDICGITMRLVSDDVCAFRKEALIPFHTARSEATDLTVRMRKSTGMLDLPRDYLKFNTTNLCFDARAKEYIQWDSCSMNKEKNRCDSWMTASADWSDATIFLDTPIPPYLENNYLITAFQSRLSYYNGFFMHGAIVEHHGKGIIFTASSGVGKSTHAELWAAHLGARILNGDKAFIRRINDRIYTYGSPWSGSSTHAINRRVPLTAIVVLEQAPENNIKKLSVLESLSLFATHCYYPTWDARITHFCLNTLDEILKKIPVYRLKCTPDKGAAFLARDAIFEVDLLSS